MSPRSTTRPFVLFVLCLQFSILQMTYVHEWCKMNFCARRPCFIDHVFLTSDFRQVPRRNFLQFFPFLVHRCFCRRNFHSLRHRNKFVNQILVLLWILLFLQNGLHDILVMNLPYAVSYIHQQKGVLRQGQRLRPVDWTGWNESRTSKMTKKVKPTCKRSSVTRPKPWSLSSTSGLTKASALAKSPQAKLSWSMLASCMAEKCSWSAQTRGCESWTTKPVPREGTEHETLGDETTGRRRRTGRRRTEWLSKWDTQIGGMRSPAGTSRRACRAHYGP